MTLHNLSALLPALSHPKELGAQNVGSGPSADSGAWAEILAAFELFAGVAQHEAELGQQGWTGSLKDLEARLGPAAGSPDLAAQFLDLFSWLESQLPTAESELSQAQTGPALPLYEGEFWPSPGEMILLLKGLSPWGDSMSPQQSAWVEQVGPFLGISELSRSYQGAALPGREMSAVSLADLAGSQAQRAFVDAWLGRHEAQTSRASYAQRWAAGAGVPGQSSPAVAVAPAAASATLTGAAEVLSLVPESSIGGREAGSDPGRLAVLSGVLSNGLVLDQRENASSLVRTDTTAVQAPTSAAARDFGPLLGGLTALQPQSASAELRAAAEQTMERVVWMAARREGLSEARLQLHPAHLGKLDIRLELQGREASVQLTVYHSAVREAVEAMLPRLREQLEEQGLNLGDAWVLDSGSEENAEGEAARSAGRVTDAAGTEDELADAAGGAPTIRRGGGLLDAYA